MQLVCTVMPGAARDMKVKICRKCRQERSIEEFRTLINGSGTRGTFHCCKYCQIFTGKDPNRKQLPYNGPYLDKYFEDGFTVYKLPSYVGTESFFGDRNHDS